MEKIYTTNNYRQTQKVGAMFAEEMLKMPQIKTAVVLGLRGNLGGGKTTFLQGFAGGLGIKENILSPTFVIQKRFIIKSPRFKNFYHIDCYRLKNEKDFSALGGPASGWKKIISNPKNIIAIEWPEKIKKILPKHTIFINFKSIGKNTREIFFKI